MDAFIQDEKGTQYDVEVQLKNEGNLPKRSRYYQSLLDSPQLKAGERGFHGLNQSYIIMITPFDLFGKQRYCYTFENVCLEEPGLHLEDGAVKMFLNTKGTNDGEVHPDLVKFLHYIENSSDQCAEESGSVRIQGLHKAIREIRASEEMGVSYMKSWELEQMLLEEGREVGKDEYARLVQLLIHAERYGDLERTAVDSEYREELIAELLSGGEEKASMGMPIENGHSYRSLVTLNRENKVNE